MTEVHIVLATHNGARFLQEQLRSYLTQSHQDWSLWVSDDASSDATRDLLNAFQKSQPQHHIRIMNGPDQGVFVNFMHLLRHPDLPTKFVALSDQDDVWFPHRLSRAFEALTHQKGPAFYCSSRISTDDRLRALSVKPPRPLPSPSFANALVQNAAPGNTMMLNPQAMQLLRGDPPPPMTLPYHDWWIYLRLMAAGATLISDPKPSLLYRQHNNNVMGHRRSQRLSRLRALFNGTYKTWVSANAKALLDLPAHSILPEHRHAAEVFVNHPSRWQALRVSKAQRSDKIGQALLPLLAVLHRV